MKNKKDVYIDGKAFCVYFSRFGSCVNWIAYEYRRNKKWWQISKTNFFSFASGSVLAPYNMEEVTKKVQERIFDRIKEIRREYEFEEHWEEFFNSSS